MQRNSLFSPEANTTPDSTNSLILIKRLVEVEDDLYSVLGVSMDSTQADIKAAYRRLLLQWHPDKRSVQSQNEVDEANERTDAIIKAYEILGDVKKRKAYNLFLKEDLDGLEKLVAEDIQGRERSWDMRLVFFIFKNADLTMFRQQTWVSDLLENHLPDTLRDLIKRAILMRLRRHEKSSMTDLQASLSPSTVPYYPASKTLMRDPQILSTTMTGTNKFNQWKFYELSCISACYRMLGEIDGAVRIERTLKHLVDINRSKFEIDVYFLEYVARYFAIAGSTEMLEGLIEQDKKTEWAVQVSSRQELLISIVGKTDPIKAANLLRQLQTEKFYQWGMREPQPYITYPLAFLRILNLWESLDNKEGAVNWLLAFAGDPTFGILQALARYGYHERVATLFDVHFKNQYELIEDDALSRDYVIATVLTLYRLKLNLRAFNLAERFAKKSCAKDYLQDLCDLLDKMIDEKQMDDARKLLLAYLPWELYASKNDIWLTRAYIPLFSQLAPIDLLLAHYQKFDELAASQTKTLKRFIEEKLVEPIAHYARPQRGNHEPSYRVEAASALYNLGEFERLKCLKDDADKHIRFVAQLALKDANTPLPAITFHSLESCPLDGIIMQAISPSLTYFSSHEHQTPSIIGTRSPS